MLRRDLAALRAARRPRRPGRAAHEALLWMRAGSQAAARRFGREAAALLLLGRSRVEVVDGNWQPAEDGRPCWTVPVWQRGEMVDLVAVAEDAAPGGGEAAAWPRWGGETLLGEFGAGADGPPVLFPDVLAWLDGFAPWLEGWRRRRDAAARIARLRLSLPLAPAHGACVVARQRSWLLLLSGLERVKVPDPAFAAWLHERLRAERRQQPLPEILAPKARREARAA